MRSIADELATQLAAARRALTEAARAVAESLRGNADAHGEALASVRVIFCTLCVAGCYLVRGMPSVSHLIVDEAAQATEPEVLIPLACEPRRLLLTGDPCQLCCMCVSAKARAAGLERSLMARLIEAKAAPLLFLDTQFVLRTPSGPFWPLLAPSDPFESLWSPSDSFGSLRTPSESFGNPLSHPDPSDPF